MKYSLAKIAVITLTLGALALGLPTTGRAQSSSRIVRVVNANGSPGVLVNVAVELAAQGNENTVGFSLAFDSGSLTYVSSAKGSAMSAGTMFLNTNSAPTGRIGVLLGLQPGDAFPAGSQQLAIFTFRVSEAVVGPIDLAITFTGQPIQTQVVSADASVLPATFTGGSVTVTPFPLVVSADNQSRAYGGANPVLTGSIIGLQPGDNITAIYSTIADTTSPVGNYPIMVTLSDPNNKLSKYSVTTNNGTLAVTQAPLNITANNQSKTYGQTVSFGSGSAQFTSSGLQNSETIGSVTLACGGGAGTASVPGSPYTITPSLATGGTFNAANYTITYVTGALTVNAAALTVTATGPSKTYGTALSAGPSTANFTASATQNGETMTGVTLTPNAAGVSATTAAGVGYTVTPSLATGGNGFVAANYNITYTPYSGTVGQAALTVTATGPSKTYGTALSAGPSTANFTASATQNGETVTGVTLTPNAAGASATAAAGVGYTVTPSLATGGNGFLAANYSITYTPYSGTVGQAALTVTATGPSKTYGTALSAGPSTANFTASATQNGETVTGVTLTPNAAGVSPTTAAGVGYTVTPSLATGGNGFLAANYSITYTPYSGTVGTAALTVTATGPSKTYGTALSAGPSTANFTASATQNGETVTSVTLTPNAAGASATTAAGVGYTVTPSLATGGNGFVAANYNITYTPYSGTVGQAALTVTATGPSKTYGTALSAGPSTANFTASATQNGETVTGVTLTPNAAGASATAAAGVGYTVTPSLATGGNGFLAANYSITYTPYSGTVGQAALTVTATGPSKTYGTALSAGPSTANFTASATQNGETVTGVTLTPNAAGASATTAAGLGYTVTPSLATGGNGFLVANYNITYAPYNGTVAVKALTVTATGPSKTYGTVLSAGVSVVNFSHSGEIAGETVTSVTLTPNAAGLLATTAAGAAYVVTPSAATGTGGFLESNYQVTYSAYNGTVGTAVLTVTATGPSKTYGTALSAGPSTANFTASATQNGETVTSVTLTPNAAGASATTAAGVGYTVTPSLATGGNGFVAANYNITYTPYSGTVGQAALTVTATGPSKTYGTALSAGPSTANFTASATQNGETVTGVTLTPNAAGASATTAAGVGYTVTPSLATGGNGFLAANYSITYTPYSGTVGQAALTVTATGPSKTYGTALSAGTSTANFTASATQNGETVTSVTLTPDAAGLSATTAAGVGYTVTPSLATGGNGFLAANYNITYTPHNGTVAAKALTITATGPSKTYGTALGAGVSAVNFSHSGEIAGETVTSVTLTPNAAGLSATTAAGAAYVVTPSAATGTGGFLESNYQVTYNAYIGTVGTAALTMTATGPSKTYGTALSAGPSTANFTASATQNGETVTSVTLTPNAAGASATTAAGVGYTVTPSLATGGNGFLAANYNITYTPYNGTVAAKALTITATGPSKTYGTALSAGVSAVNFSHSGEIAGETVTSVTLTPNAAGLLATTAAGAAYVVTPSAATGTGGFLESNYQVTYNANNGTVGTAALTVTATGPSKTYGTALSAGPSTANFTASATQNGETVTGVTLTPDAAGLSATTAAGLGYTVTPSLATGGNGFLAANYNITYTPYSGTVGQADLTVTATGPSKTYGTALSAGPSTANSTASATQNGETVTGVTLTPDAAGLSATTAAGAAYMVTPSAATGGSGFSAANYSITYVVYHGTVGTAALTVTANNQSKTYGQTLSFGSGSTQFTSSGLQNSETIGSVTLAVSGNGGTATTAVSGSPYTITPSAATGGTFNVANYTITYNTGNLTVNAAALTVTAINQSKTYGQTVGFGSGSTSFTSSGLQNSETIGSVTLACSGGAATAAAGSYPITPSLATGGTFSAANYAISYNTGTLAVNAEALTVAGILAQNKVYDGTTAATLDVSNAALVGVVSGDAATLNATNAAGAFTDKNVGTSKNVTVTGLTVSGADAGNYTLTQPTLTADITPAGLLVTGITASNKVYDATTVATLNTNSAALVRVPPLPARPGDIGFRFLSHTNTTSAFASYITAEPYQVGSNCLALAAIVNSDASLTPTNFSGNGLSWQRILVTNFSTLASPTRSLTVYAAMSNNISALDRGTAQFTANQTGCNIYLCEITNVWFANGVLGAIVQANARAANSSANPSIALSALQPGGQNAVVAFFGGASNPFNATPEAGWTEDVDMGYPTPSTGLGACHRLQTTDNTLVLTRAASDWASAMLELRSLNDGPPQGPLGGDDVKLITAGATGTFADGEVALGKTVQIAGLTINGNDAANYTLTQPTTTANITPAPLTVTAADTNKVYGSTLGFAGTEYTLTGTLYDGDTLTNVTLASAGAPGTAAAGSYAITPSAAQGTGLNNYTISYDNGTLAVGPKAAVVAANPKSKIYGEVNPGLDAAVTGTVNGDTLSYTLGTTAAQFSPVGGYPITVTLGINPNYTVTPTDSTLTVGPKAAVVAANPKSKIYGQVNPGLDAAVTGTVNGDTLNYTLGTTAVQFSPVGGYPITVTLGINPNYTVTPTDSTLTVGAAALTVLATDANRVYGQTNPVFTATYSGFLNGETNNVLGGALVFTCSAETNSPVGIYAIEPSGLTAANYSITFSNGTLRVLPYGLTVRAEDKSKTYGQADPGFTVSYSGFVNGETESVLGGVLAFSRAAGENVGGYAITPSGLTSTNYAITFAEGTLTIEKASAVVAANPKSKIYGQVNPGLDAAVTGTVNGDTLNYTLGTTAAQFSPVGGYPITVTLGVNPNYTVTPTDSTLTVGPKAAAVAANPKSKIYGQVNPGLDAAVTGTVNGDTLNYTLGTTAAQFSPVGGYPITVTLGINPNYTVTPTDSTLTVGPKAAAVAANPKSKIYGQVNPGLDAAVTGTVNGDTLNYTLGTTAAQFSPVGGYPITVTLGVNPNYTVTPTDSTLAVGPKAAVVAANPKSKIYGQVNPGLDAAVTGTVNGDTLSYTLGTTAAQFSPVGGYPITVTLGINPNYTVTPTDSTLTVGPKAAVVAANPKSKIYGQVNPGLDAAVTGTVNGDTLNYTLGTTAVQFSPVGGYPITVTLGVNPNYAVTPTDSTLTVGAAALTVLATDASRVYGQTNPVFTATYSGFLNGETNTVLGGALVFTCSAETNSPVGIYAIEPSGLTAANYSITFSNGTLRVLPYGLTVRAEDKSKTYGQADPGFTVSYSGFVNGETESVLGGVLAFSRAAGENVGGYAITPSGLTSTNYAITFAEGTLTIEKASAVVAANPKSKIYGQVNPGLDAVVTGTVNGDTLNYTLGTTAVQFSPVGGYPITVTLGINPNYTVTPTDSTLTVGPKAAAVAANPKSKIYGQVNPGLDAAVTGTVNGDTLSYTLGTTAAQFSPVGGYPITVTLGINPNYTVTPTDSTLTVGPKAAVVAANPKSKIYGQVNPGLDAAVTGTVNGDTLNYTLGTTAVQFSPVGGYPITVTLGVNPNYAVTPTDSTLTVGAAALTVLATDASRVYGQTNPVFTATYSGFLNGETNTVLGGALVFTCSAETNSPVGIYAIEPSGLTAANYSITFSNGTLRVLPYGLTVRAEDKSKTYGQADPGFTVSYSGFVNGETESVLGGVLAFSRAAGENVGGYAITPSGLTSTNYAITFAQGTLTIEKAPLAIRAQPQSKVYGASDPALSYTVSGLQFSDTAAGVLAGALARAAGESVGSYAITQGNVAANANYSINFTPSTLTIGPAGLTITANNQSKGYGAALPALTVSYGGFVNGDTAASLTTAPTVTTTGTASSPVGIYPITASGALDANYTISYVAGTLTVSPAVLVVTANNTNRVYGATNPVFTGTITGLLNGDNITATYATTATLNSPVGAYTITPTLVDPSGKLNNYIVNSANGTLTITPANSDTLVASSRNPSLYGSNVTFTATVTPIWPATTTPRGVVRFYTNGVVLGSPVALTGGVASLSTASLPPGTYTVLAAYMGDGNFLGSTGSLDQVVSVIQTPITVGIEDNGDGSVTVSFSGTPGAQYIVQASGNLGSPGAWTNISTNIAGTDGHWSFTDSTVNHPIRFYRAMVP